MTDDNLIQMKNNAEFILNQTLALIKERKSVVMSGISSETKKNDEFKLAENNPYNFYVFKHLNVSIYINRARSSKFYSVVCENWQPKPQAQFEDFNIYRGRYSIGHKETLKDCLELFYLVVKEFLYQELAKCEVLF